MGCHTGCCNSLSLNSLGGSTDQILLLDLTRKEIEKETQEICLGNLINCSTFYPKSLKIIE